MLLDYTLWLYILIVISIVLVLIINDKEVIHSIIFTLVIGLLFLLITKPPNDVDIDTDDISSVCIYFAIFFISIISIILYSGIMAYTSLDKVKLKN